MFDSGRRVLAVLSSGFAATALVAWALPASSGASPVDLSHCDNAALSQPFSQWADPSYYKLAPGGDFEGTLDGWALDGGAGAGAGSEPYGVSGSIGSQSLTIPAGASATSPATCVNAAYPDFRLFTRTDSPSASVSVSVVYESPSGQVTVPVGIVTPVSSWQPSAPMATGSAIAGAGNGGTANVSLRFSANGGTVQIDDVYVDPWGRCC